MELDPPPTRFRNRFGNRVRHDWSGGQKIGGAAAGVEGTRHHGRPSRESAPISMGRNLVDDALPSFGGVLIPDRCIDASEITTETVPETSQRSHRSARAIDDGPTPAVVRFTVRLETYPGEPAARRNSGARGNYRSRRGRTVGGALRGEPAGKYLQFFQGSLPPGGDLLHQTASAKTLTILALERAPRSTSNLMHPGHRLGQEKGVPEVAGRW